MKNLNKLLWGAVLVLIGLIWGVNALGLAEINIFFDGWWTLFIIVPCFIDIFDGEKENRIGDVIGFILGIVLLLACRNVFSFDIIWKLLLPCIIVIIGISLMIGSYFKTSVAKKIEDFETKDLEPIVAVFGEQIVNKNNEKFTGANLDSIFGGITLDLSNAKLNKETFIKTSSIFGGITIVVPSDVEVKVKSLPIFGGITNKVNHTDAKKVIYIDAFCLFGGIDIK